MDGSRPVRILTPEQVESENQSEARLRPRTLAELEMVHVSRVLDESGWNMTRAARVLGIDRGTLYHKVRKFGLERPRELQ